TFNYNDDATDPTNVTVAHGRTVDKPADPQRDGYTFDDWYEIDSTTAFDFTTAITGNVVLMANWTGNPVTITAPYLTPNCGLEAYMYSDNDNVGTVYNTSSTLSINAYVGDTIYLNIGSGEDTSATLAEGTGYQFTSDSGSNGSMNYYITGFTDNVTLMLDVAVKYPPNSTQTLDEFVSGLTSGDQGISSLTVSVPSNITKPADSGIVTYETYEVHEVTFDPGYDGATATSVWVEDGKPVSRPTDPQRDGYTFDGWYLVAATETQFVFTSTVDEDITLKAHWTANPVTLTAPYLTSTCGMYADMYLNEDEDNSVTNEGGTLSIDAHVGDTVNLYIGRGDYDEASLAAGTGYQFRSESDSDGYDTWYYITGFTDDVTLMLDVFTQYPLDSEKTLDAFVSGYTGAQGLNSLTVSVPSNMTKPADSGIVKYKTYEVHEVTFDPGYDGASATSVWVEDGYAVDRPADPERDGYTFAGWYQTDSQSEFGFNYMTIESDITLTAHWTANSATITAPYMLASRSSMVAISLTDGTTTQSTMQTDISLATTVGTVLTLTVNNFDERIVSVEPAETGGITVTKTGTSSDGVTYTISGFTGNVVLAFDVTVKKPYENEQSLTEFANLFYDSSNTAGLNSLTCQYPENTEATQIPTGGFVSYEPYEVYFTVTFVDEGGNGSGEQQVRYNETVKAPDAPIRDGYAFVGWCDTSDLIDLYNFSRQVEGDITLYAKWGYTVTFIVPDGATPVDPIAASGWTISEPVAEPTMEGESFYGWYEDAEYENQFILGYTSSIDRDLTLYARFEPCMEMPFIALNSDLYGVDGPEYKSFYDSSTGTESYRAPISGGSISFSVYFNDGEATPYAEGIEFSKSVSSDGGSDIVYSANGLTSSFTLELDVKVKLFESSEEKLIEALGEINDDDYSSFIEGYPQDRGIHSLTLLYPSHLNIDELNNLNPYPDFVSFEPYEVYTVTLNTMGGEPMDPVFADPAESPATVWIADPEREGYTFAGWYVEGTNTAFDSETAVTGDVTLVAHWTLTGAYVPTSFSAGETGTAPYTVSLYGSDGATKTLTVAAENAASFFPAGSDDIDAVYTVTIGEDDLICSVTAIQMDALLGETATGSITTSNVDGETAITLSVSGTYEDPNLGAASTAVSLQQGYAVFTGGTSTVGGASARTWTITPYSNFLDAAYYFFTYDKDGNGTADWVFVRQ
ncbi:MAG: InlB B-repeat-containing protein, partial [Firmicutes bacterium]|nr:InlB B-repeat-containing protein [Bacillota bacterium]